LRFWPSFASAVICRGVETLVELLRSVGFSFIHLFIFWFLFSRIVAYESFILLYDIFDKTKVLNSDMLEDVNSIALVRVLGYVVM